MYDMDEENRAERKWQRQLRWQSLVDRVVDVLLHGAWVCGIVACFGFLVVICFWIFDNFGLGETASPFLAGFMQFIALLAVVPWVVLLGGSIVYVVGADLLRVARRVRRKERARDILKHHWYWVCIAVVVVDLLWGDGSLFMIASIFFPV